MRRVLLSLAAAGLLMPAAAKGHSGCHGRDCLERVARKQCSQVRVVPCIRRAALHHRVDVSMLLRKARCESRLRPRAVSPGGHFGLFQFLPSTFATTPYRGRPILSAKFNSLAAAWMHREDVGRGGEWACR